VVICAAAGGDAASTATANATPRIDIRLNMISLLPNPEPVQD
jgi:hypothetical protein